MSRLLARRILAGGILLGLLGAQAADARHSEVYAANGDPLATFDVYQIDVNTGQWADIGNLAFRSLAIALNPSVGPAPSLVYYTERGGTRLGSFNPNTGVNTVIGTLGVEIAPRLAFHPDRTLYGFARTTGDLYRINVAVPSATLVGTISQSIGLGGDMAFAPDGTLYALTDTGFFRIDLTTLVVTVLGNPGLAATGLGFSADGRLFATDDQFGLYRINPANGRATLVSRVGTEVSNDSTGDILWWGGDCDGDGLTTGDEILIHRTDPCDLDTDDDGLGDFEEVMSTNTDPANPDTDGDGIQDGTELGRVLGVADPDGAGEIDATDSSKFQKDLDPTTRTNPLIADTDAGGAVDGAEDVNHNGRLDPGETDPTVPNTADDGPDTDADGISDVMEMTLGTNPRNPDTDGDGIRDGEEIRPGVDGIFTDPRDADTDDDGISDGVELILGLDPNNPDTDGDGLQDGTEVGRTQATAVADPDGPGPLKGTNRTIFIPDANPATTTDPRNIDTDLGGVPDGLEDRNRNGRIDAGETNPNDNIDDADTDQDGIPDAIEVAIGTDPMNHDSDGDGLNDGEEVLAGDDGYVTNPLDQDTDDDGISDSEEVYGYHTDPLDPDTDHDGLLDGTEVGETVGTPDTNPAVFVPDANPATTTDPTDPDTDEGGATEHQEDMNANGRIDPPLECNPVNNTPDDINCIPRDSDGDGIPDAEEVILGTDPNNPDTDGDGLDDGYELVLGTDPLDLDTDDDGIDDGEEVEIGGDGVITNPIDNDTDGDGLLDGTELGYTMGVPDPDGAGPIDGTDSRIFIADADPSTRTDPNDVDTDDGGVPDGGEDFNRNGRLDPGEINPTVGNGPDDRDTDRDGLADAYEILIGTDPNNPDTDGDGLNDGEEVLSGDDERVTDPLDRDTDDDGLSDGEEVLVYGTDPTNRDTDGDGLQDGTELGRTTGTPDTDPLIFIPDADPGTTTNPRDPDTDHGGVRDGVEDANHNGRVDPGEANPTVGNAADDRDTDGDGIPDLLEMTLYGTDPNNPDTDGDGIIDGEEVVPGTDGSTSDPLDQDTDDDGLSDGEEVHRWRTDPLDPDTDGDLIFDGTEVGNTVALPDTNVSVGVFVPDADPSSTTNPHDPDTDEGGRIDGDEDANQNGRVDSGECNPRVGSDDLTCGLVGVSLLRNDETTTLSPLTPARAAIYTGVGNDSLDRFGPNSVPDEGEGANLCSNGADDDDFYIASIVSGTVDPDPCPVVPDATRPLIIYELSEPTNTLKLVKEAGGSVRVTF